MPAVPAALADLRVLDLGRGIAPAYCTKLLADAGAEVVRPVGRNDGADGAGESALFRFLRAGVQRTSLDHGAVLADVALVVTDDRGTAAELSGRPKRSASLVSITPFGRTGPWADRPADEFTVQALAGVIGPRGRTDRPPLCAGGRIAEWAAGTFAAVGALTAYRWARRDGRAHDVDVSMLECAVLSLLVYPWVLRPGIPDPTLGMEIPSVEPTSDGWVGFCTMTAAQWVAFARMIGREDLGADPSLSNVIGRMRRGAEMREAIHGWTRQRTTAEIVDVAATFRVPATFIGSGATLAEHEPYRSRAVMVERYGHLAPRPAVRFAPAEGARGAGPGRGTGTSRTDGPAGGGVAGAPGSRPCEGLRVLDFTAFWAGPFATQYLATMGADVVKVESLTRPDFFRMVGAPPPTTEGWYEHGPLFHANNVGKRSVTLELGTPQGADLARQLAARSDVVVENFTPRVLEGFGLGHEALLAVDPALVVVRMPAFGLEGPWRDRPGFAQTVEQASGMAWVTGDAGGPPTIPRGPGDPLAGMHAVFGLLCALEHRDRTGVGGLVEVPLCDVAANLTAEQVIEWTSSGRLLERDGNHAHHAVPHGVYGSAGRWVAVSVDDGARWAALRGVLGEPAWAADPKLDTLDGRRASEDAIDDALARWIEGREPGDAVATLVGAGVPAAVVVDDSTLAGNEQLRARGFFEAVNHPVAGTLELPGWPMAMGLGHWYGSPAPVLGQHNSEVLGDELGLDAAELEALGAAGVIGTAPTG